MNHDNNKGANLQWQNVDGETYIKFEGHPVKVLELTSSSVSADRNQWIVLSSTSVHMLADIEMAPPTPTHKKKKKAISSIIK